METILISIGSAVVLMLGGLFVGYMVGFLEGHSDGWNHGWNDRGQH